MSDSNGYYKTLGISSNASQDDIRKAYLKLAAKTHPDKITDPIEKEKAHKKFIEIGRAYEELSDATKRKQYDMGTKFDPFSDMNQTEFNMNPFANFPFTQKSSSNIFEHFNKLFAEQMANMNKTNTHASSMSTSVSQSTMFVNGKKTTIIKEVTNNNGVITEKITNIDTNGNKTETVKVIGENIKTIGNKKN